MCNKVSSASLQKTQTGESTSCRWNKKRPVGSKLYNNLYWNHMRHFSRNIITINHVCVFMYVQTKLTNTTCTAGTRHSTHCSIPLASVSTTLPPPAHCVCRSPWWSPVATSCPGFETLALAPLSSTLQQLMVRGIQDCLFRSVDNSPPDNQSPKKWTK